MIGNMIKAVSRQQRGASKLPGLLSRLSESVDAFAAHRMQMAVPEYALRRAERAAAQSRQATAH